MSWIDDLLERGVVPTSTVTLVPGILELSDAALDPTDIPPVNAELSGTVAIGNVSFDVTIHVPSLLYSVRKSQPGSGSWPLGALLADLGLGGLDLDELTVTDMVLAGSLRTGVLAAQVSFDAAQTWTPGSGPDVPSAARAAPMRGSRPPDRSSAPTSRPTCPGPSTGTVGI
jgi:hypothetical protein